MTKKTSGLNFAAAPAPAAPVDVAAPAASPAPIAQPLPAAPTASKATKAPRVALPATAPRPAPVPAEPKSARPRRVIAPSDTMTKVEQAAPEKACLYWIGVLEHSPVQQCHIGAISFCRRTEAVRYLNSLGKTERTALRGEVTALPDWRIEKIAEQLKRSWVRVRQVEPTATFGSQGAMPLIGDEHVVASIVEVPRPADQEETRRNFGVASPFIHPLPTDTPLAEHVFCIPFERFEQQSLMVAEPLSVAETGLVFSDVVFDPTTMKVADNGYDDILRQVRTTAPDDAWQKAIKQERKMLVRERDEKQSTPASRRAVLEQMLEREIAAERAAAEKPQ